MTWRLVETTTRATEPPQRARGPCPTRGRRARDASQGRPGVSGAPWWTAPGSPLKKVLDEACAAVFGANGHRVTPGWGTFNHPARIDVPNVSQRADASYLSLEEPPRFELGNGGFADHCLTTWLWLLVPSYVPNAGRSINVRRAPPRHSRCPAGPPRRGRRAAQRRDAGGAIAQRRTCSVDG